MANVVQVFPFSALSFALKDALKLMFKTDSKNKNSNFKLIGNFCAGGIAGVVSMMFVYPIYFARTRLAADIGRYQY